MHARTLELVFVSAYVRMRVCAYKYQCIRTYALVFVSASGGYTEDDTSVYKQNEGCVCMCRCAGRCRYCMYVCICKRYINMYVYLMCRLMYVQMYRNRRLGHSYA